MGASKDLILYYPRGHGDHYEIGHPERPERVETIWQALQTQFDLEAIAQVVGSADLPDEVLHAIHSQAYLERLAQYSRLGRHLDPDTYTTQESAGIAHQTAGGAVAVARAIWNLEGRRGFAVTRPPGHHASAQRSMGFCLLNNIALAAEDLRQGAGAQRLVIVDLDLHHGNGTQEIFWERGDVFYLSTHQYPYYPGTGRLEETGSGGGLGATANFPLPAASGDEAFHEIMQTLILPLLDRFAPEMILVSVGFDTHWRDPLGQLFLSAQAYGQLVSALTGWADRNCDGRIALFLEGGYDLQACAACALACTTAMLGADWEDPLGPAPWSAGETWRQVVRLARALWSL